jgi:hypothetical protein
MITFTFTVEDLARTRFAISPMWELITGLRTLQDTKRAALHLPWVREALPIARGLDLGTALLIAPSNGYMPDFLTPPPMTPVASFEEELEVLKATPAAQVRHDVALLYGRRKPPERVQRLVEHPRRELGRLADVLAEFWELALERYWPRIRALLEADLAYRSRRLTEGGAAGLFGDLHEGITWHGDRVDVESACFTTVSTLSGKGLLLVPSALQWQKPASITEAPWQPTVLYPARGVGLLWEPGEREGSEALAGIIGPARAALLDALDAPRSTTDLARQLNLTAGGVSQHLARLKAARLVAGTRNGRSVLYVRTPLAEQLVDGA